MNPGMPGSGKTVVSRHLQKTFGWCDPFPKEADHLWSTDRKLQKMALNLELPQCRGGFVRRDISVLLSVGQSTPQVNDNAAEDS
jgi:hypothetical protein